MNYPEGLDVFFHEGEEYKPMHDFGTWRVAILRYAPRFDFATMTCLERHMETDEIFILVSGTATLVIGEDAVKVPMEKGKIYNIRKGAFHNVDVSRDGEIIIVENNDTSDKNTEFTDLPADFAR